MFLKPNGKQISVETLDGESKVVNTSDIYKSEIISTRYQQRIDFFHGANNYVFITGNMHIFDGEIIEGVLDSNFIDVNNVEYDFDMT